VLHEARHQVGDGGTRQQLRRAPAGGGGGGGVLSLQLGTGHGTGPTSRPAEGCSSVELAALSAVLGAASMVRAGINKHRQQAAGSSSSRQQAALAALAAATHQRMVAALRATSSQFCTRTSSSAASWPTASRA
jgi:hypothetical protein